MDKVLSVNAVIGMKDDVRKGYLAKYGGVWVETTKANNIWLIDGESIRLLEYVGRDLRWLRCVREDACHIETQVLEPKSAIPKISINGGPWVCICTQSITSILDIMYNMDTSLKLAAHGDGSDIEVFPELEKTLVDLIDLALHVMVISAAGHDLFIMNPHSEIHNTYLATLGCDFKIQYNCDVQMIEID